MKKLFTAAVLATLCGLGVWLFASPPAQAPEVTFSTLSGKQLQMSALRGKVILVKFWATSCVTCVAQMPDNMDNFNTYHTKGFEVVAVAMQYDPANYVINFVETRKIPFTVALDTRGQVAQAFGEVKLTPTQKTAPRRFHRRNLLRANRTAPRPRPPSATCRRSCQNGCPVILTRSRQR